MSKRTVVIWCIIYVVGCALSIWANIAFINFFHWLGWIHA